MPSLTAHQSNKVVKLLMIGDSGAGKTGSLTSLVQAGYHLRILDWDNGLDSLSSQVRARCADKTANVDFHTLRDRYKGTAAGVVVDGMPTAFVNGMKLLDRWGDLGVPASWDSNHVVVVDSLTFMSQCAFNHSAALNPGAKDRRQIYGHAQDSVEHAIALLTSEAFQPNVIVIAHTKYLERPDGTTKGFPTAVGQALSPKIPTYFNSVALCETVGVGKGLQRVLRTTSTAMIDLKNPAAFAMSEVLPIETALATFFDTVKNPTQSKGTVR